MNIRHLIWPLLFFISGLFNNPLPSWATTCKVDIIHSQDRYPVAGSYPILFQIHISKPWYIHGTNESDNGLVPTVLSFPEIPEVEVKEFQFPEPEKKRFEYTNKQVEVYSGKLLVRATVVISEKAHTGKQLIEGRLSYQACSPTSCQPPENVPISVSLFIAPRGAPAELQNQVIFNRGGGVPVIQENIAGWRLGASLWLTLLGIFLGGLALNLTPCIYPLIPITVSYFGGRSGKTKGRTVAHGLLYISGLAFTNSLLGVTASLSGSMLGSALQNPSVLIAVAAILLFLASSFFGLWELQIPSGLMRVASKNFSGYFGTFFMGLTLGIVAAPCLGPFILGLLTYVGQKGDPLVGFLYFFVLSLGLGVPLSVLAIFSGALEKLPLSGEWMVWIRKLLGWVLVGMAGYMLQPLIWSSIVKALLFASILIVAGIHLGWFDRSHGTLRVFLFVKKGVGVILICGAIIPFINISPERPGIQWIPYDQTALGQAIQEKKPVILDFYADWCGPCRTMEKKVFTDPQVVELSQNFVPLRVDLTKRHSHQAELLKRYQVRGVPTVIFMNKDGIEEKYLRIESFVKRNDVLRRMKRFLEKQK